MCTEVELVAMNAIFVLVKSALWASRNNPGLLNFWTTTMVSIHKANSTASNHYSRCLLLRNYSSTLCDQPFHSLGSSVFQPFGKHFFSRYPIQLKLHNLLKGTPRISLPTRQKWSYMPPCWPNSSRSDKHSNSDRLAWITATPMFLGLSTFWHFPILLLAERPRTMALEQPHAYSAILEWEQLLPDRESGIGYLSIYVVYIYTKAAFHDVLEQTSWICRTYLCKLFGSRGYLLDLSSPV